MDISYFCNKMDPNSILLSCKGQITSEVITSILNTIESKMNDMQEKPQLHRKVYTILVELLQNLYYHMDTPLLGSDIKSEAILLIGKEEDHYRVITGNYVKNNVVRSLKKKLDEINAHTPGELRVQYKKMLVNGQLSYKGGAGLGMIDIASKTGNPLIYDFTPVDGDFSFFSLDVIIK